MKENTVKNIRKDNQAGKRNRSVKDVRSRAAFIFLLAVVFVAGLLISGRSGSVVNAAEGTDDIEYKYYTTITVKKGDTLWDLALENYSEKYYDSIGDYVDEVKAINGLKDDTIHEGAKLVIVYFSSEYK